MSRTVRKNLYSPNTCAPSDKPWKVIEHRRERATVKAMLHKGETEMPHPKLFGNPWLAPKDGKRRIDPDRFAGLRNLGR